MLRQLLAWEAVEQSFLGGREGLALLHPRCKSGEMRGERGAGKVALLQVGRGSMRSSHKTEAVLTDLQTPSFLSDAVVAS